MKKNCIAITIICFFLLIILTDTVLTDNNIYQQDSIQLELEILTNLELVAENSGAKIQKLSAELLLYPVDDYRQTLLDFESDGKVENNKVNFVWNEPALGEKQFSYLATIQTNNQIKKIKSKILFPLTNVQEYQQYLLPTKTIDSDDPKVVAKATELAEGETDLFKVAFNLASWVEENVEYDLNTLTATASQKASWVLENKKGVCDEMTSLFVAMCRSLGIPARFVSGVSYSTMDLFANEWEPHGWAEVYFPNVGWVSFDITFGEFGYVDVTHIKLRDGFDPAEPATRYEWLANAVRLEADQPLLNIIVQKEGSFVPEEILLEQELLSSEVGFGSYNLVKGIIKNTADHYIATALKLSLPKEVEIIGRNRRNILLSPKEVKETFWLVKIKDNLDPDYSYEFPAIIYTEKNNSVQDSFSSQQGKTVYSKEEIEELTVKDEEKIYSRKITISCEYPNEIKFGQEETAGCKLKNIGNTNLQNINYCLNDFCENIDLPINQEKSARIVINGGKAGWNKLIVSAENELVEKRSSFEYMVLDEPKLAAEFDYPPRINLGNNIQLRVKLKKLSFSAPQNVEVIVDGLRLENRWSLVELSKDEQLNLLIENPPLAKNNKLEISMSWKDKNGMQYSEQREILIYGQANSFSDSVKMFCNRIINFFS